MDKQRRIFIKGVGFISATALLPGCVSDGPTAPPSPDPQPDPDPQPPQPDPDPSPPQPDPQPDPDPPQPDPDPQPPQPDPDPDPPRPDPDPRPQPDPDPGLFIREDVATMSSDHPTLVAYRNAITAMQALPDSDPRSWTAQARIHEDFCPHGNWFFLPWHRAYLHRFENICRELSGDSNFALPYWDWTNNPQVPATFWGIGNPLNDTTRQVVPSDIASPASVDEAVIAGILAENEFEIFGSGRATELRPPFRSYGPLEQNPHNSIHIFVGGNMGDVPTAGLDPLFWLHHANIDRIWAQWNANGNLNSSDTGWRNFNFNGQFVDTDGSPLNINVADTLNLATLGFTYTGIPATPVISRAAISLAPPQERATFASFNSTQSRLNQPISIAVRNQDKFLREATATEALSRSVSSRKIYAVIGKLSAPKNEQLTVRVFINCSYLSQSTPVSDPHYAGSFGFFASTHTGPHHHESELAFNIDITETVNRLAKLGEIDESNLNVQLLPVGFPGRDTTNTNFIARKIEIRYR